MLLTPSAPGSTLPTLSSRVRPSRSAGAVTSTIAPDMYACRSARAELFLGRSVLVSCRSISSNFVRACKQGMEDKLIVIFNLLWSEFIETNERRFDLLLQILIKRWLSLIWPRYRRKDLGVDGEQLVSLITIHGGGVLFDVNGLLDFT